MKGRALSRGFTLIELAIAIAVGSVILLAALQVVSTQTRLFTVESESSQVEGNIRGAAAVMQTALLELSFSEGDILGVGGDSIRVRSITGGGIVCGVESVGGGVVYGIRDVTGDLSVGDSVFAYRVTDDDWVSASVASASDLGATIKFCQYGDSASHPIEDRIAIAGVADTLFVGAPVRSFEHTTFRVSQLGGQNWITRRVGSDSAQALAGPLSSATDLFTFYNSDNGVTTTPANVRRVEMTIRGRSPAPISQGTGYLQDSVTVSVKIRN